MRSSIAIVALVATTIGFSTVLPVAAEDAVAPPAPAATTPDNPDMLDARFMPQGGMRQGGMGRGLELLGLACSPKGSEALDVALVHMSYRLQLTADQQKLFDTFRDKALTTETSFADTCKTAMPDRSADAKPDLLTGLKARLAIDQARLTAMNDVLPDFEALYNRLTDAQKQALLPHWDHGDGRWDDRGGADRMGRPPAPGRG